MAPCWGSGFCFGRRRPKWAGGREFCAGSGTWWGPPAVVVAVGGFALAVPGRLLHPAPGLSLRRGAGPLWGSGWARAQRRRWSTSVSSLGRRGRLYMWVRVLTASGDCRSRGRLLAAGRRLRWVQLPQSISTPRSTGPGRRVSFRLRLRCRPDAVHWRWLNSHLLRAWSFRDVTHRPTRRCSRRSRGLRSRDRG